MYSYKPLLERLKNANLKKSDLTIKLGISSKTISKISKGEIIANHVLNKIAAYLNCNAEDLYIKKLDNHILEILKEEKRRLEFEQRAAIRISCKQEDKNAGHRDHALPGAVERLQTAF